jgi:hypothetical protein
MENSGTERELTQQDLARFWQALHDGRIARRPLFVGAGGCQPGPDPAVAAAAPLLPKNQPEGPKICGKKDTGTVPQRGTGISGLEL